MTESNTMKDKIAEGLKNFGVPRLIIAGFLLLLLIMAPFVGADLPTQISNIINRFSWNGILVLADLISGFRSALFPDFWGQPCRSSSDSPAVFPS